MKIYQKEEILKICKENGIVAKYRKQSLYCKTEKDYFLAQKIFNIKNENINFSITYGCYK